MTTPPAHWYFNRIGSSAKHIADLTGHTVTNLEQTYLFKAIDTFYAGKIYNDTVVNAMCLTFTLDNTVCPGCSGILSYNNFSPSLHEFIMNDICSLD